jgi:hypothetical protein
VKTKEMDRGKVAELLPLLRNPEGGLQVLLRLAAETADSAPTLRDDQSAPRARVFAFVMGGR